jgi:hypothetical protein
MRLRTIAVLAGLAAATSSLASFPALAQANPGYELDTPLSSRSLPGPSRGIAVDQATQDVYVAITSTNPASGAKGQINRFNSGLTDNDVFSPGGGFYTGVAVNPVTGDFYASQIKLDLAQGTFGIPRMDVFSSLDGGSLGTFPIPDAGSLPPIATDSAGRVFYPNSAGHKVEVFDSAGVLKQTITCTGCTGGSFGRPISVALDAADNLYVADVSPDRVVKLTPGGGGIYSFAAVLQSGKGAAAVGVDPSSGDVLVGDLPGGTDYHIVAYDSSGVQFDDFGAGLFPDPLQSPPGAATNLAYQIAVNGTTNKVYVGSNESFRIFKRTDPIEPPTAAASAATNVGQITATLNATVNAEGHAALTCDVEYTDEADSGYTHPTVKPCPSKPDGSASTAVNVNVQGLAAETAYRYRFKVSTNAGSVTTDSETFETLPVVLPTATTAQPEAITQTSASIKGSVNPQGGSVSSCRFELGTSTAYGTNLSCLTPPGVATSNVTETRKLTNLTPGTTYHYRLVIVTNAGTDQGEDVVFKTASPPAEPEPEAPSAPPSAPAPPAATSPPPAEAPIVRPRPRRCKKGFHRRKVRGKVRCVRKKRSHRHRRRAKGR